DSADFYGDRTTPDDHGHMRIMTPLWEKPQKRLSKGRPEEERSIPSSPRIPGEGAEWPGDSCRNRPLMNEHRLPRPCRRSPIAKCRHLPTPDTRPHASSRVMVHYGRCSASLFII